MERRPPPIGSEAGTSIATKLAPEPLAAATALCFENLEWLVLCLVAIWRRAWSASKRLLVRRVRRALALAIKMVLENRKAAQPR
jgi:hypothetical protein